MNILYIFQVLFLTIGLLGIVIFYPRGDSMMVALSVINLMAVIFIDTMILNERVRKLQDEEAIRQSVEIALKK